MSTDEQKPNVIPGTGWFELGKARTIANDALISLAIIIGGAALTGLQDWIQSLIRDAPIPENIQIALFAVNTWLSSIVRGYVFPQPTKIKESKP